MKKISEAETEKASKTAGKYLISEAENYWIASANSAKLSVSLSFNKQTRRYEATTLSTLHFLFPKLAKGYGSNDECPINKNHLPKSDFLLLDPLPKIISERTTKDWYDRLNHLMLGNRPPSPTSQS